MGERTVLNTTYVQVSDGGKDVFHHGGRVGFTVGVCMPNKNRAGKESCRKKNKCQKHNVVERNNAERHNAERHDAERHDVERHDVERHKVETTTT